MARYPVKLSLLLLALTAGLAGRGLAQDDDEGSAAEEHKSPAGTWRIEVPEDWTALELPDDQRCVEGVRFVREEAARRLVLQIQVPRRNLSFESLVQMMKGQMEDEGIEISNESREPVDGRSAWRCERPVDAGGVNVLSGQIIVDGGARKIMLVYSGLNPLTDEERETLGAMIQTLRVAFEEPKLTFEYEAKDFGAAGLKIDLPKGGKTTRESDDGMEITWEESGLIFMAEWDRTPMSCVDRCRFEFGSIDPTEEKEFYPVIFDEAPVQIGGKTCHRVRLHGISRGTKVMTMTALIRAPASGEVQVCAFGIMGEVSLDVLKPLEERLEKAQLKTHFAPPLSAIPGLMTSVKVWEGRASLKVPKDWGTTRVAPPKDRPEGPAVSERKAWGVPGATDLSLRFETGTMTGGAKAYEEWTTKGMFKKRHKAVATKPRAIVVGGREGKAWEVEAGPEKDRWVHRVVVVMDGDRYCEISVHYPVGQKKVYEGLPEKAAATVEWTEKK